MDAGEMTLPFWMVYDDRAGAVPPIAATNVPLVETEKYVDAGLWKSAETLEELAEQIGVPADELVATVARYNELAGKGVDEDFGRGDEPYDLAFTGGGSAWFRSRRARSMPHSSASPTWAPRRSAHRHRRAGARHRRRTDPRSVRRRQHHGRTEWHRVPGRWQPDRYERALRAPRGA